MNFDAMKRFLTQDTSPALLAKELDDLIFDFIRVYGQSCDALAENEFAPYIYTLRELRDIFSAM